MLELSKMNEAMSEIKIKYQSCNLEKLLKIDLSQDEGKLELTLEILSLTPSLPIKFAINLKNREFTLNKVKQLINDAINFKGNENIVAGKLSEVLALLVKSLAANNTKTQFIYEVLPEVFSKDEDYDAFIAKNKINQSLLADWNFFGVEGKEYAGKGFKDAMKLTGDECLDILEENMDEWDNDIGQAIIYITDKENKKKVNKNFQSTRLAALNILKAVLIKEHTDIINFVKKEISEEPIKKSVDEGELAETEVENK